MRMLKVRKVFVQNIQLVRYSLGNIQQYICAPESGPANYIKCQVLNRGLSSTRDGQVTNEG
jgi:hypothetical protein